MIMTVDVRCLPVVDESFNILLRLLAISIDSIFLFKFGLLRDHQSLQSKHQWSCKAPSKTSIICPTSKTCCSSSSV